MKMCASFSNIIKNLKWRKNIRSSKAFLSTRLHEASCPWSWSCTQVCPNGPLSSVGVVALMASSFSQVQVYKHTRSYLRGRQWYPPPALLPGKSHGRRSLVGFSPWGCEESDTTERLHFHFSLSCIGEGNGNPLQCSCLKNPRDSGAWWTAVCGVAQSRTWLKQLSGSSSKKGWALKNWCFWIVLKTLESPLDYKEIKSVIPKGNQSWIFRTERTDAEGEVPILWPPDAKSRLTGKDSNARKDWGQKEKRVAEDEIVRWHHGLREHEF